MRTKHTTLRDLCKAYWTNTYWEDTRGTVGFRHPRLGGIWWYVSIGGVFCVVGKTAEPKGKLKNIKNLMPA